MLNEAILAKLKQEGHDSPLVRQALSEAYELGRRFERTSLASMLYRLQDAGPRTDQPWTIQDALAHTLRLERNRTIVECVGYIQSRGES